MNQLLDQDLVAFMAACETVTIDARGVTADVETGPVRYGPGAFLVTFRKGPRCITVGLPRTLSQDEAQDRCHFAVERLLELEHVPKEAA